MLEQTNWQMLKILEKEIDAPSNSEGDWLDALVVAMDFLKEQTLYDLPAVWILRVRTVILLSAISNRGKKFRTSKIILMSPFAAEVNEDSVNVVMEGLLKMQSEIVVM